MEKKLRYLGFAEAVSFLILLFIAMPLKYAMDLPIYVRIVGSIHGILFLIFVCGAIGIATENSWPKKRLLLVFAASVLPFGPFIFDRKIFP